MKALKIMVGLVAAGIFCLLPQPAWAAEPQSKTAIEVKMGIKTLYLQEEGVTEINASGCTALESLSCSGNQLTSLDVSDCTTLESLSCSGNQLTSLDVSGCTTLESLSCSGNQLTSLDVSGCTTLESLSCSGNQLTGLDVSGCTALTSLRDVHADTLRIRGESMSTLTIKSTGSSSGDYYSIGVLDASGCTSLRELTLTPYTNNYYSYYGTINSLKLQGCTSLMYLNCASNQLTSLDVSGCTALTKLKCSGNQLTSLDVSGYTALMELYCVVNQLSSLDVSGCTSLTSLECNGNQLSSLDVSGCTSLDSLYCSENQLTGLDVSGCTALTSLNCGNNQLAALDVSRNTALTFLDCSYNRLHLPVLYNAYSRRSYSSFSAVGQWDSIVLPAGEELDLSSERRFGQSISTYKMTDQYGSELHASDMWEEKGFVFRFNEPYTYWLKMVNVAIGNASFTWRISVTGEQSAVYFSIQTIANNTDWGTVAMAGNGRYREGTEVTVIAAAKTGYRFVNWTGKDGAVISMEAVYTFVVSGDLELTANFEKIPEEEESFAVSLSANNPEWGLVSQLGKGSYKEGEEATIIATANAGYRFVNWKKKDGSEFSTEAIHTFTVTEDIELTANFEEQRPENYTVRLSVNNAGWGTATVSGSGTYEEGTEATITARPTEGYRFVNWTRKDGAVFSTDTVYRFTVRENLELTANFEGIPEEEVSFTVDLFSNDPAWGLVSQLGTGIYDEAEEATIIATPNTGYRFVHWTKKDGGVFSTDAIYTFTVTEDVELTANFEKLPDAGNEDFTEDKLYVYVKDHTIYLSSERGLVRVYNAAGVCVYSGQDTAIPVHSGGLYIVRVGERAYKAVVR